MATLGVDKCSFCGKSERQFRHLARGPSALICDECVAFFYEDILPDALASMPVSRSIAESSIRITLPEIGGFGYGLTDA